MGFRNPITHAIDQVARDAANAAATSIIPGTRLAADAIDGKTITGATVQTAATGLRWVMTGQAGDADRLLGYTGASGEQAPGQVQVGFSPGDISAAGDFGFLYLTPPIIGPSYVAGRPELTAFGSTRDGSSPGRWQIDGAADFTGAVTLEQPPNGAVPRGLVNGGRSTATVGSIAATAVRLGMGFTVTLTAGRAYRYLGDLRVFTDVANTTAGVAARLTAGTTATPAATDPPFVTRNVTLATATNPMGMTPQRAFQVATSGTYQVNLWINRTAGTGLITAQVTAMGDMFHELEDAGPATAGLLTI